MLHYQELVFTTHVRILNSHIKTLNLKYQEQHRLKSLNFLLDIIPYYTFKTILSISSRSMKHLQINHKCKQVSTKFRIELHSGLSLDTILTMKLLGSTEQKTTKDKNGENLPQLEITEVV